MCQAASEDKKCERCGGDSNDRRKRRAIGFLSENGSGKTPTSISVQSAKIILIETSSSGKCSAADLKPSHYRWISFTFIKANKLRYK